MTAMRLRRHSSVKSDWKCPCADVRLWNTSKQRYKVTSNFTASYVTLRHVKTTHQSQLSRKNPSSVHFYTFFTWKTTSLSKTGAQDLAVYIMDLETAINCKKMRALWKVPLSIEIHFQIHVMPVRVRIHIDIYLIENRRSSLNIEFQIIFCKDKLHCCKEKTVGGYVYVWHDAYSHIYPPILSEFSLSHSHSMKAIFRFWIYFSRVWIYLYLGCVGRQIWLRQK